MKDELGRNIMKQFAALGSITHSYLIYNNNQDKKQMTQNVTKKHKKHNKNRSQISYCP